MLLGMSSLGVADGIAKYLGQRLNGIEVVWGYFVAIFICVAAYAFATRAPVARLVRSRRPWLQAGRAGELADASMVAPLNYVRLVWAVGIGYLVFGDIPASATFVGGAIIVASGLYVLYRETGRARRGP